MLFVNQEEQRASDTVLFTSENNDTAIESVDTSFFIGEKNRKTNQLASLARRDYFYLDAFHRVNLAMYIIITFYRLCMKVKKPLSYEHWISVWNSFWYRTLLLFPFYYFSRLHTPSVIDA